MCARLTLGRPGEEVKSQGTGYPSRHRSGRSIDGWRVDPFACGQSAGSVPTSSSAFRPFRVCVSSVRPFRLFLRHALNFVHICFPDRSDSHFVLSLSLPLLTSGTPPQWRLLYAIAYLALRLLFRQLKSETTPARDAISITVADTVAYGSGATGRIPHGSISTP